MPKKKQTELSVKNTKPKSGSGAKYLIVLVLWTVVAVGMYYALAIKMQVSWIIDLYFWISLPCLGAAVVVNSVNNIKYSAAMLRDKSENSQSTEKKPDEKLVPKIKSVVKWLIVAGLPPFVCVMLDIIIIIFNEKY